MGTGLYLRNEWIYMPLPLHICTIGRFNPIVGMTIFAGTESFGTAAWPANNLAIYTPLNLPAPFKVARFMVANGGNNVGTMDVGIYTQAGALITHATTAARSSNSNQFLDVTDIDLPAGYYYLGLVNSSTTGQFMRATIGSAEDARACGLLQESLGSAVLPANMTPVAYTSTIVFHYGLTQSGTL